MSSRRRTRQPGNTETQPASQIDHLVVMRESAMYDKVLMEGMIHQTLHKVATLPGAEELLDAGMDVFDTPQRYGGVTKKSGKSRVVMIERDGALYLYSMGSAAENDQYESNTFIQTLVDAVESYRPKEVWVVAFTRLLRSANYVGELLRAFSENIDTLHAETDIDLATPEGRMMFQLFGMVAASERDYIVRRHTAGRVAQCRRGEWISNSYPPGYRIEDKKLVLDDSLVEPVRGMLRILAHPALTRSERAARIGALEVTTPMITRIHGPGATIADARNPTEVIRTLVGWADTYQEGRYEMLWKNPFPNREEVSGLPVEEMEGYPYGVLRLAVDVPVPDDGWADETVFDAIHSQSGNESVTGGASHSSTPPLSGLFRFTNGGHEHNIAAGRSDYRLLRRPLDPKREHRGWITDSGYDAEWLATVSRTEWHRSIADAVIRAVQVGLPAELDSQRFQSQGPLPQVDARRTRIRAARKQLRDAGHAVERAHRNAQLAGDDEAAQLFVDDVKYHHSETRRLEREIAELEAGFEEPELQATFETNAGLVAYAIAALADAGRAADSSLRNALRTVISKERWRLEGDRVLWELDIELPHAEGTV